MPTQKDRQLPGGPKWYIGNGILKSLVWVKHIFLRKKKEMLFVYLVVPTFVFLCFIS